MFIKSYNINDYKFVFWYFLFTYKDYIYIIKKCLKCKYCSILLKNN